ncbi:hypothetical protein DTO013F2_8640 [Penicillium roqueforti]|nr:hypothetical protein DTO013F2_8640 [Penicillium roqueforti]
MYAQSGIVASGWGHSYLPIFQLNLEIAALSVPYRWWEDEATAFLWAFDIQEIGRVVRFALFRDENFIRTTLCHRNVDTINTFLIALSEPDERQFIENLSHIQRVEEILRRSSISPFQAVPWSWLPPQASPTLDAGAVAMAIEAESHFHFRHVAFEELVRAALGYNAISVEWFLQQHAAFYIILRDYLTAYPEDIALYVEVEKHLRSRSPFAHGALVQCLLAVRRSENRETPEPRGAGFEFIADPLQALFKDQPGRLAVTFKMLSVLTIRFRHQYVHAPTMDWKTPFDTSIPFLDDYLESTSPTDLASSMRGLDEQNFSELTRQSLIAEGSVVGQLKVQWRELSVSVWECCAALPDLIPYIQECAHYLFTTRDYHSFTAITKGLDTYNILKRRPGNTSTTSGNMVTLEPLISLMEPSQNFAAYRQHYQKFPGIPFLVPHIRDYKANGTSVLQPVFQYLESIH